MVGSDPKPTIAGILRDNIAAYHEKYKMDSHLLKVVDDITRCHTLACGRHLTVCTCCGTVEFSYNSCRNRHCPDCQNAQKHKWMQQRKKELLPVSYFHLVFTVPHQLNALFMSNKAICYKLLFDSVWATIDHFAQMPKWLGAKAGCTALLHTWGQNLSYHPHIHCIMPSGGLTEDGSEWLSTHPRYFAPVRELSEWFKKHLIKSISAAKGQLEQTTGEREFSDLLAGLQKINWVVFAQPSFTKPDYVIDYLGNYTHKIAISNHRLIKVEDGNVFFGWKDYKDGGSQKVMHLPVLEFIRRYLEHILPPNFYKIRHFGIFANRFKAQNIEDARECLRLQDKEMELVDGDDTGVEITLPHGCPYMGACRHCGGAKVSLYHLQISEFKDTELPLLAG